MVDSCGVIVSWNSAAERLYGYAASQIIGQNFALLVPDSSQAEVIAQFRRVCDGVADEQTTALRRCSDGTTIPVSVRRICIQGTDEQPQGILELGSVPFCAEQPEYSFRLAVEACPAGMILVSREGRIAFANAAAEQMFGYERDELACASVEVLVPLAARKAHEALRRDFVAVSGAQRMGPGRELMALRKDQTSFPVEISLNAIPMRGDVHVLAVINDISERKLTESKLRAQREELERSNRDLEQFAYLASHDLQEPLRMVASYTELLRERYEGRLDEKADKYIRFAVEGARRMQRLIADILAYSRVGSRCEPTGPARLDMVLKRVTASLRDVIGATGARIDHGPMPIVLGDEVQLEQLFQNLLGNALKFRGTVAPVVTVVAERAGAHWQFAVADNGVGFDPEYAERIFQMFQRLHGRDEYEGTGIGLAIAKRIVECHGGRIWARSQPGRGSTFQFTLQALPAEQPQGDHGPPAP